MNITSINFPINRLAELKSKNNCKVQCKESFLNQILQRSNHIVISNFNYPLNEMDGNLDFVTEVSIIDDQSCNYSQLIHLRKFPNMKSLYMPNCRIDFGGLKALQKMKSLDHLEFLQIDSDCLNYNDGLKHLLSKYKILKIELMNPVVSRNEQKRQKRKIKLWI